MPRRKRTAKPSSQLKPVKTRSEALRESFERHSRDLKGFKFNRKSRATKRARVY